MSKVRIGDGTGTATVERRDGDGVQIRYPSGARRTVHKRNVAKPDEATPAEHELLAMLVDAGDVGLAHPPIHLRVATLSLIRAGYAVEDGPRLLLTTIGAAKAAGR